MIAVSDLYNSGLPMEFVQLLPTHCDSCGEENEITESFTILRCSNQACGEKATQRLVALLQDLGVKNMGESKCRQFLEHFDTNNPYAIFMYEPDEDGPLYNGCSQDFSETFFMELQKKKRMLLWEFVKIGNLPKIRDGARKLLSNYDSLEEFYDDLEGGGIAFVQDLLAIKGKKANVGSIFAEDDEFEEESDELVSVKAIDTYNTLIYFKDELMSAVEFVDIKELTTEVVNICISTSVGKPYGSKVDFVHQMNEEFGHKIHLNSLGSVSKDCQFLIWSKIGSPTTKVKKAIAHNEKRRLLNIKNEVDEDEGMIEVLTGVEFRDYLLTL